MSKAQRIILILAIGLGVSGFVCYQFARGFRFTGDRGAVYDTWETANAQFKVRITAYYEEGIVMPGAFFTCESAPTGSNEWREFKAFRADDAVPVSSFSQRFRFANDQTAYFYTADDFLVSVDGGRSWSVWKPALQLPSKHPIYWAITEAYVEANGKGRAKLEAYNEDARDRVALEVNTDNYGRSWNMAQATAKHNNAVQLTAR